MTRPRAAVVVTGSELVRGELRDGNGPFLARELVGLGFEVGRIVVVGDRPDDLEPALREGLQADLCVVSGGLGPTHDDRTVELLARVAGVATETDPALEHEIAAVSTRIAERLGRPYADFAPGVRKQATLPAGAVPIGLAGTAPGFVLPAAGGAVVVVLPGPPAELRRLWPRALAVEPVRHVVEHVRPRARRILRFFGVSESAVAQALAEAGGEPEGVDATVCARDLETEIALLADVGSEAQADAIVEVVRARLGRALFAADDRTVEELVLELCRARGLSLATAESCTGGLVGARLTSVPGSSDVFAGAVVAYSDAIKRAELGVSDELLARHGAVSAEVAAAMAAGARARLGVDVAVSVTGIAGPDGGTPEKPVGLVFVHAQGPDGERRARLELPGDRETVRRRATAAALHAVRELLARTRDKRV